MTKPSGNSSRQNLLTLVGCVLILIWLVASAPAQTCQTATDMESPLRTTLETTSRRYFDLASRGDSAGLQQNTIPSLAASFGGIEAAVKENQASFAGAQATVRPPFVLTAEGTQPLAHAEFLCGVFGSTGQTRDSAVFMFPNLPPGKYAVAMVDAKGSDNTRTLTLILQQMGADWKLAGFYVRSAQVNGHDATWFAQRAREFKAKGQTHNAWLYFREAISLSTPADFMGTLATDKLYDESQALRPSDLPADGNTFDLTVGGATYKLTAVFPSSAGNDLNLVVRYQAASISNTVQTFQMNAALMKGLVAKVPEFRDAFAGVVVRAVDPSGQDYGSMMAMKDIK